MRRQSDWPVEKFWQPNHAQCHHHEVLRLGFQHGETLEEIWQAHTFTLQAAELGFAPAKWLAAAALDRWLMYQSRAQKYDTQFVPDGRHYRLWEVDPTTPDADRAAWDVPFV